MTISLDPPAPVTELDTTTMTIDDLLDSAWFYYARQLTVKQAKQTGVDQLLIHYQKADTVYQKADVIQQVIRCCQDVLQG